MASYEYLAAFNNQQKALKEKERQSKATTAEILHHYHGGEHDITEHERLQANLRRTEQLTRQHVLEELHHYGHFTSPGVDGSSLMKPMVEEQESHAPPAEAEKEAERIIGTQADAVLVAGVDGSTMEPMLEEVIVADAEDSALPEHGATANRIAAEADAETAKEKEVERVFETYAEAMLIAAAAAAAPGATSRLTEELLQELLQERTSKLGLEDDFNAATMNEGEIDPNPKCLELEYAFGLLYPATEPAPDLSTCTRAAADIVPDTFRQPMGKTKVSYNANFTPIVTSVQKDDTFVSNDDSVRYVVKGRMSVFMDEDNKVETESLRNSLKSEASFRRTDAVMKDDKDNEGTDEVVVGKEEGGKWKKVRDGAPVLWERVVKEAEGKQP